MESIILIDGMSFIYRGYYAFQKIPRITTKGFNTSPIFGFLNSLLFILENLKSDYVAVVLDSKEKTHRHLIFEKYKANRPPPPNPVIEALPYIHKIMEGMGIKILTLPGYEADDIMATIATKAAKDGIQSYIATSDKDLCQIVSDKINLYRPGFKEKEWKLYGNKEVLERFNIRYPLQVIDFLALTGDPTDNIPGIKGIGEKTASELLHKFNDLFEIYENLDKIQKESTKEKLLQQKDMAFLSRELATINSSLPIPVNLNELKKKEINPDILIPIFKELEFSKIAEKILGEDIHQKTSLIAEKNTISSVPHNYTKISNVEELNTVCNEILEKKLPIAVDVETNGLSWQNAEIISLSIATSPHQAYFIYFPEKSINYFLEPLKKVLENDKITKIGHNIKFDAQILKSNNIHIVPPFFDTMIAYTVLHPEGARKNIDALAHSLLNYEKISFKELTNKKDLDLKKVPVDLLKDYNCEDADIALQLYHKLQTEIDASSARQLFYEVEMPLIEVIMDMERTGIKIDISLLNKIKSEFNAERQSLENEIYKLAGKIFNISSPKQLADVLYKDLKITDKPPETEKGQYSTSEEELTKFKDAHPIVPLILEHRELQKLISSYLTPLAEMVWEKSGKIHTSFNQIGAETGRVTSESPNLQNIPIRTPKGKKIREAFVPSTADGYLLSADYSQIELRILAHFSQEPKLIEAFLKDTDIHASTASWIFNKNLQDITPEMRRIGKTINFGIIYGMTSQGLADRLNIKRKEAENFIKIYFSNFPNVQKYIEIVTQEATRDGYVQTLFGRRRYIPEITSSNPVVRKSAQRMAINTPVQGTAADIIKIAMVQLYQILKKNYPEVKMLLQIHDELVFELPPDYDPNIPQIIKTQMENVIKLNVPLKVDIGIGKNWLSAHP